jgi:adenosine deaminase
VYSLLHCHFESALRAMRIAAPAKARRIPEVYRWPAYRLGTPQQRLTLLWREVLRLSDDESMFSEDTYRRIVRQLLSDAQASLVEHIDLRVGPSTGRWRWMHSASDGICAFRSELAHRPLSVAFLAGINMNRPRRQVDDIFDTLFSDGELTRHIAGVDVNFLASDLPTFDRHVGSLRRLQNLGLKVNIHLGELFSNETSRYVLSRIIPNRIGHGVLLLDDPYLVSLVKAEHICLDMCPTSNTTLGVHDWRAHSPAGRALDLGIPVSINTDDPVLFATSITREMRLAGLTQSQHNTVVAHARNFRYAPA